MRARRQTLVVVLAIFAALLAACSNAPPPPVVQTPAAATTTPPPPPPSEIVVGVNSIAGGYNPHNMADTSTITTALSQLLLPSVFRQTKNGAAREPKLDTTLMTSAEVISRKPFTVAYNIRPDASWSDGAPIAAEDFVFLAESMRVEPGVVDPAGYRLISDIDSRGGGKRVEVTFSQPYPAWRTLFTNLLPQHLLKDAPGGWQSALKGSFPAYGGPFAVKNIDSDRGEIILERNERYWEKPAAVDRLVLRRADQPAIAAALRSGNDQLALTRADATGTKLFDQLGPEVGVQTIPRPEVASVLLRPVGTALSDDRVRSAVLAMVDRNKLIEEGAAGGPSADLRADAQVLPPSEPGYAPTMPDAGPPATPDPASAEDYLERAGYRREVGRWHKDGKPLSLVLAAPAGREPYASIAKELARQLTTAGVQVHTINPPPRELFGNMLARGAPGSATADSEPNPGVDIAVVGQPTGGDPASVLASTFGCRPGRDADGQNEAATLAPNPSGSCDPSMQSTIDAALTGSISDTAALRQLESKLWRRDVVLPLFQLADTLAVGPGVSGVTPGAPMEGPFSNAANWTKEPK